MPSTSLAEYLFNRLRQLGIGSIHGVPGDYNLALLDYVEPAGLRWVGNTNELNAAYAADGYARIKGVGALITTFGVGELSAVNAIAGAYAERAAVVHIVGTPARAAQEGRKLFHHTLNDGEFRRFANIYAQVTVAQAKIWDAGTAPRQIDDVLRQCLVQSRPVYIEVPVDLVGAEVVEVGLLDSIKLDAVSPSSKSDRILARIIDRIYNAKHPILLVDGESRPMGIVEAVQALVTSSGWPTWCTGFAKGLLNETLPNFHGIYRGSYDSPAVTKLFDQCDLVLFFGPHLSSSNSYGYSSIPEVEKTISFTDNEVNIGTEVIRDVHANFVITRLAQCLDLNKISRYDPYPDLPRDSLLSFSTAKVEESISQDRVWRLVANFLRQGDIVLGETGTAGHGVREMALPKHARLFTPVTWLSIGYMLPAAQGASLAQEELISSSSYHGISDARTVLFIGDGSFQMTAQEMATIIRLDLDVVVFLINNDGYTIERCIHGRKQVYNDIGRWRYLEAPKLFGARSDTFTASVRTWGELRKVLEDERLRKGKGLRMVEVVMDREDAPQGPLLEYLRDQKARDLVIANTVHLYPTTPTTSSPTATPPNRYPNPGYVGSSSHSVIFNHIPPAPDASGTFSREETTTTLATAARPQPEDELLLHQGAESLRNLFDAFPLPSMKELVKVWLTSGANLSLTGGIIQHCIDAINLLVPTTSDDWHVLNARNLLTNSGRPLELDSPTFPEFCAQFIDHDLRWEMLGIFLAAVTRAAIDTPFFPSLYASDERRYTLRRLCTRACDYALELSLSLDCLNDLQVFLQYENWILHTHVYGDQSYSSWRKLGDLISSIYARGYHEKLPDGNPGPPFFVAEMRKAVFARAYSADKNVAIFVGRPPRMNRHFCHFQVPCCSPGSDVWLLSVSRSGQASDTNVCHWDPDTKASFMAESRWTALCATLKEDLLYLHREHSGGTVAFRERASEIKLRADEQFRLLPSHFQHCGSLRARARALDRFEGDFLGAVRLNHLHVLFLLQLLQLDSPAQPDPPIIEVAEEMVLIVVDLILLRDRLVNSGTSLVWKIAYYGLPAAGILLLAMLNRRSTPTNAPHSPSPRALQHLTVLAAELQAGSIIQPRDPNYDLMAKATHALQSFIDSAMSETMQTDYAPRLPDPMMDEWPGFTNSLPMDFEIGFWESLADHPLLNLNGPSGSTGLE
ncbi:uncharacterized protein DSM5745_00040 [Aspergillus mulundensis]|uniref:Pyruvate decarboxylase n=1 Tax=Aspergillus mulundensis TaxID=1810919 RepID=A0A3D8T3Z3_9EURO|nr:hypothetical protein DSM5745_00040 [Aspergillus mulundensis]RDW92718.1 hypothetical protein DSM5745_00040 [Aspergillus mulundensis]